MAGRDVCAGVVGVCGEWRFGQQRSVRCHHRRRGNVQEFLIMKTRCLVWVVMALALSGCAVVHQSDGGTAYGVFTGGLFELDGLLIR